MSDNDPLKALRERLQQESAENDRRLLQSLRRELKEEDAGREWDQLRGAASVPQRTKVPSRPSWNETWAALLAWRVPQAIATVLIAVLLLLVFNGPRGISLAMIVPPTKGGPPPLASPWVSANVVLEVKWKEMSLVIPLKDGGALTGKLSLPETGPPGAPALPYQFDLSVRGRSGTGAEIIGTGQLLVMPNDSATTRSKLKPATILWAKLNLKLQAGGQEDPVYRVFGTP